MFPEGVGVAKEGFRVRNSANSGDVIFNICTSGEVRMWGATLARFEAAEAALRSRVNARRF